MAGKVRAKSAAKIGTAPARPTAAATLEVAAKEGEHYLKTLARVTLDPGVRHAQLAMAFAQQVFGDKNQPSIMDSTEVIAESLVKAEKGDKRMASRLLTSQAISLDTMFTELARRSAMNLGEYPDAMDRYMRLALKAQSACRTTLETLTKLHQPREQTVKHVHVNQGGQAIVADQFHNHTGGIENGKSGKQSCATGPADKSTALPSPDAQGSGVPITSRKRKAAMQDARRD
jgi:hypothetical protein